MVCFLTTRATVTVSAVAFLCGFSRAAAQACGDSFLTCPSSEVSDLSLALSGETTDFERALLEQVEADLGRWNRAAIQYGAKTVEEYLRPIFPAFPSYFSEGSEGSLRHEEAVRYALHLFFVRSKGWLLQGLDPSRSGGLSDIPVLVERPSLLVAGGVVDLVRAQIAGQGLNLRGLALLAATLERLLNETHLDMLKVVYRAQRAPLRGAVDRATAEKLIETFMAAYIVGENISASPAAEILEMHETIGERFPVWKETAEFIQNNKERMFGRNKNLNFNELARIIDRIGERFGEFEDSQCRDLREELLSSEDIGTGRVRLSAFYSKALNEDKWQFSESVNYLRSLGALDESDSTMGPRVLVANYVAARTNCVADNRHYAVCCRSRCEAFREQLERAIAAPDATPAAIASTIANSSATLDSASSPSEDAMQEAAGALTTTMLQKLEEVAQRHSGRVPLHGRLFSQWLHFAYPRDCPYPHEAGTSRSVDSDAWLADTDEDSTATEEEMRQYVPSGAGSSAPSTVPMPAGSDLGMWTSAEELVAPRGFARAPASRPIEAIRMVVLLAAAVSFAGSLIVRADSLLGFVRRTETPQEEEKYHM